MGLWAYPQELVPLSYRLHRELAAEHGGAERWGYRQVSCGSLSAFVTEEDLRPKHKAEDVVASPAPPTANGTAADPLPIQSRVQEENGQATKDWEKLPKQDDAAAGSVSKSPLPPDLDWIDARLVRGYGVMGSAGATDTAQVHPYQFTTSMARLAQDKGVDVRTGAQVTKINAAKADGVQSVEYLERETGATHTLSGVTDVVVTAGPWTGVLLPRSKVEGLRAHSVVWEADVSPYAVFTDISLPAGYVPEHRLRMGQGRKHKGNVDPEIYARPGNEVYACGQSYLFIFLSLSPLLSRGISSESNRFPNPLSLIHPSAHPIHRQPLPSAPHPFTSHASLSHPPIQPLQSSIYSSSHTHPHRLAKASHKLKPQNKNRRARPHDAPPRNSRPSPGRHGAVRRPSSLRGHRVAGAGGRARPRPPGLLPAAAHALRRRARPADRPHRHAGPVGGGRPHVLGHPERARHGLSHGRDAARRRRPQRQRRQVRSQEVQGLNSSLEVRLARAGEET